MPIPKSAKNLAYIESSLSILDAIQLRHPPLQRQFTLLQPLQRLSPCNHLLPKLWSRRQRPNTRPPTLPTRHKTSQPVFSPPIASLAMLICRFDTQDGLYDCAWSEVHENQLVTASGDGSVKLFDITLKVGHLFQCEEGLKGLGISDTELEGTFTGSIFSTLVTDREIHIRLLLLGHNNQNCRTPPFLI